MKVVITGKIIVFRKGEIYLFTNEPDIHLEPLTSLAKICGPKRRADYGDKVIPINEE